MTPRSRSAPPKKPGPKKRPVPRPPKREAAGPIEMIDLPGGARPHPALGLGLWALGRWTTEDEAHTKATVARAYERGIRWFDTAEVYGNGRSERLLGEVLLAGTGVEVGFKIISSPHDALTRQVDASTYFGSSPVLELDGETEEEG
jgi:hypothetical protein